MKLGRWLLNATTLLLLLLCIAAVVLWMRSYRTRDVCYHWGRNPRAGGFIIGSSKGSFFYARTTRLYIDLVVHAGWGLESRPQIQFPNGAAQVLLIAEIVSDPSYGLSDYWLGFSHSLKICYFQDWGRFGPFLRVPFWFIALALSGLPSLRVALIFAARHRRRRARRGLCRACGYDLRATPDRCPDCGTTVSSPM
jgi:hypothetical protein